MKPSVTCVCLTADRQAYTDRAVKCFLSQTYPEKNLLILDNGREPYELKLDCDDLRHITCLRMNPPGRTIGGLRNLAAGVCQHTDIIAHWDSDDWSHPLRLAWQVQQLTDAAGSPLREVTGYRTLLFWRKADETSWLFTHTTPGYGVGTSLTYWRKTWEAHPFSDLNIGEDFTWLRDKVGYEHCGSEPGFFKDEPAMVAEIHESNTTVQTIPGDSWKRVPEWDERLRERMKL